MKRKRTLLPDPSYSKEIKRKIDTNGNSESETLAFSCDVMQVICSYLLNDHPTLINIKRCLASDPFFLDVHSLYHNSLRNIMTDRFLFLFKDNPQCISFSEAEIALLTEKNMQYNSSPEELLYHCARTATFPNITKRLLPHCPLESKLKALEMIGPATWKIDEDEIRKYEATLVAFLDEIWTIDEKRTQFYLDRRITYFRGVDYELATHFFILTEKFDKNIVLRNARNIHHLVSLSYLKQLVKQGKLDPATLVARLTSVKEEDSEEVQKFFFLLEHGAKWKLAASTFIDYPDIAAKDIDWFFQQFLTKFPCHRFLLDKQVIRALRLRTNCNSDLLDLFAESHSLQDTKYQPVIAQILERKEVKSLQNLYNQILEFYELRCEPQETWQEVLEKVLPMIMSRDNPVDMEYIKKELQNSEWASSLHDLLEVPMWRLDKILEDATNRIKAETIACSTEGLRYLVRSAGLTPQLKKVFNSLSSRGRISFLETLGSGGWFGWIDYLILSQ